MAPGQPRFDLERAHAKALSFSDRFRALRRFAVGNINRSASFLPEPAQISHMVGMRMREEDQFHGQLFRRDALKHFAGIRTGIESHRLVAGRIPGEISIHRHVAIDGIELREPLDFLNRLGIPFPCRQFTKGDGIEI
jgi:hypothetical protein